MGKLKEFDQIVRFFPVLYLAGVASAELFSEGNALAEFVELTQGEGLPAVAECIFRAEVNLHHQSVSASSQGSH